MRTIVAGVLVSVTAMSLLASCGDDDKLVIPTTTTNTTTTNITTNITTNTSTNTSTVDTEVTVPTGVTFPAGAIPSDATVPDAMIDQMITQFEAAGMKVDKECFKDLLADESLRNIVAAGGAPSQDAIQKFFTCIKT